MPVEQRVLTTTSGACRALRRLWDFLRARHSNKPYEQATFDDVVREAVADAVAQQVAANIDIVSDGEMSKMSYSYYVQDRLEGLTAAADADMTDSQLRRIQTLRDCRSGFSGLCGVCRPHRNRSGHSGAARVCRSSRASGFGASQSRIGLPKSSGDVGRSAVLFHDRRVAWCHRDVRVSIQPLCDGR